MGSLWQIARGSEKPLLFRKMKKSKRSDDSVLVLKELG